jgi:hypothetical protein
MGIIDRLASPLSARKPITCAYQNKSSCPYCCLSLYLVSLEHLIVDHIDTLFVWWLQACIFLLLTVYKVPHLVLAAHARSSREAGWSDAELMPRVSGSCTSLFLRLAIPAVVSSRSLNRRMMAPSFIAPAALRNENPETPSTPSACFYYDSLTRLHKSQTASRKPHKCDILHHGFSSSTCLSGCENWLGSSARHYGTVLITFFQPRTHETDKVVKAASQGIMHFP